MVAPRRYSVFFFFASSQCVYCMLRYFSIRVPQPPLRLNVYIQRGATARDSQTGFQLLSDGGKNKKKKRNHGVNLERGNATGNFPLFICSVYTETIKRELPVRFLPEENSHIIFPSAEGCGSIDNLLELRMLPPSSEE